MPRVDRSRCVVRHVLERRASEDPERECVLFEDGTIWTSRDALAEASRAANALRVLGVERDDVVITLTTSGIDALRAQWGIALLGAIHVPLNTAYKGELLGDLVRAATRAKVVVCDRDLAPRFDGLGVEVPVVASDELADAADDLPALDRPIEPWDTGTILFTSGTTGRSKGVIIPNLMSYTTAASVWEGHIGPGDTFLVDLPLFHIGARDPIMTALTFDARIALRSVFAGSTWVDVLRATNATHVVMPGTVAAFLAATPTRPDDADNDLRFVVSAPLPPDLDAFKARFGIETFATVFGMTEAGCVCRELDPPNRETCGMPRPGAQVRLVDEHDYPVPTGEIGEMIVRRDDPWEMNAGYLEQPDATLEAWRNGWFHTGDLFRCDDDGRFYFVDRQKDSLRRRGENISSFEVEHQVMQHPSVTQCACVGVPDEYGGDEVKVFLVVDDDSTFDHVDLIEFLRPRMPYFMIPRYVEVVGELPVTPTARVQKHLLRDLGNSSATWDREAAGIVVSRRD